MDETKLDAPTLRAAQHIRKFIPWKPDVTSLTMTNGFTAAFVYAAESLDNWAIEVEMAGAKRREASSCTCSPSPGAGTGEMRCPSCMALDELVNEAYLDALRSQDAYQKKLRAVKASRGGT